MDRRSTFKAFAAGAIAGFVAPAGNVAAQQGGGGAASGTGPADAKQGSETMKSVVGTWQLVRATATAADGKALPAPYGGEKGMGRVILNADGRMMAVLCDGRPALPAGTVREYSSYCGNYTFDGRQLITRVDAASEPSRIGSDQVRDVRFEDNLLVLRPPLRAYGAKPAEQRELYWEKIADV